MRITTTQRAGLHMIARGYTPRRITVQALKDRGLAEGPLAAPRLTRAGAHVAEIGSATGERITG